jgi:flagellar biosynthesis/type III secretory pathway protein FliH
VVVQIRAEAEADGHARGLDEAHAAIEARTAAALETIAARAAGLREDMARTEAAIVADAAEIARAIGLRVGAEALHDDPLAVVAPIIERTLSELTGPHRIRIVVNDILQAVVEARAQDIAYTIGLEGGIRVVGGAEDIADCRIEWASGAVERNHREIVAEVSRRFENHGFAGADNGPETPPRPADPEAGDVGTDTRDPGAPPEEN